MRSFFYLCMCLHLSEAFVTQQLSRVPNLHDSQAVTKYVCQGLKARLPSFLLAGSASENDDYHQITIEYCPGCRWGLRAFWFAQELLTTFNDVDALQAVTIMPSRPPAEGGRFVVQSYHTTQDGKPIGDGEPTLLWDRWDKGTFPELKELKQLVRDQIDPDLYLGHSDSKDRLEDHDGDATKIESFNENYEGLDDDQLHIPVIQGNVSPHVSILYCTGCRWLLRAAYYSQELMSTFSEEINSITLIPGRPPVKGGAFVVQVNGNVIWDRAEEGRFPETKELKQRVRDVLNPAKDLGNSDVNSDVKNGTDQKPPGSETVVVEEMDDDEAAEARKYFGIM